MDRSNGAFSVILRRGMVVLLAVLLCCGSLPALARGEQAVRVGCFPLNGFFDIAADGTVSGYGAAYTEAVFSHMGQDFAYVRYSSWVDALDALQRGEIDLVSPAQHTAERDAAYAFNAFPICTEYGALLTLSTNDKLIYEDFAAFEGLKVGCASDVVFLPEFEQYAVLNGFTVELVSYRDTPALLAALKAGEVDAIVANLMVKTETMKLLARFGAAPVYYMLRTEETALCEALDHAIDRLSSQHPDYQSVLSSAYLDSYDEVPLSRSDMDFIAQSDVLTVAVGGSFPPFAYRDAATGEIAGVDRSIFEEIGQMTGLRFAFVTLPEGSDVAAFLAQESVALVLGVQNDSAVKGLHGAGFTDSYLTIPKYFFGKAGTEVDIEAKMTVAVASAADAQLSTWHTRYPTFTFLRKESAEECIQAVHSGEADLLLNDRYSMESLLSAPQNQDIQLMPVSAIDCPICCKVVLAGDEAQNEQLTAILNKAIDQLPASDKEKYISQQVQLNRYQHSISDFLFEYRWHLTALAGVLLAAAAALVLILHARRRSQAMVAENELKLRNITNNINGGVIVLGSDTGLEITYANDGFLELIGCTREHFEESGNGSYLTYVHPDDVDKLHAAIVSGKQEFSQELRVMKHDKSYLPAIFNCTVGRKKDGTAELYCVIMDMSDTYRLLEELRIDKRRTELILDRVNEIFYEVDLAKGTVTTSSSFRSRLGWELPRKAPEDGIGIEQVWRAAPEDLPKLRKATGEVLTRKKPVSCMIRIECKPQSRFVWCEVLQHPILSKDGNVVSVIGLIRDVDKEITEREQLIQQTRRDPLTGLYNKEAFEQIVRDELTQMPYQNHAMVFIDLDHFKTLNDTLGHMTGDRAICEAADKLRIIFANYDVLSRFGGDEFCIFVKDIPTQTLRGKMDWLVEKLHADYEGPGGKVRITCSCGVACTEKFGFSFATLMQCADEALYYSKGQGRDRFTFYRDIPASALGHRGAAPQN